MENLNLLNRYSERNTQHFKDIVTVSSTTMWLPLREPREIENFNLSLQTPVCLSLW